MSTPFNEITGENDQTRARQEHLEALRRLVGNVYPNKFERSEVVEPGREDTITAIVEKFRAFEPKSAEGERPAPEAIELANQQLNQITVRLAGRIASPPRVMGKAAFVHLSDGVSRLQIYVRKADVTGRQQRLADWSRRGQRLGTFRAARPRRFHRRRRLSVHHQDRRAIGACAEACSFWRKRLLPMPDKMHGINDPEIRQRQRYADLIAGSLKLEREEDELNAARSFRTALSSDSRDAPHSSTIMATSKSRRRC